MSEHLMRDRYAGLADFYEEFAAESAGKGRADVVGLLGAGRRLCLDVGCGMGLYFDAIAATGRTLVGIDFSGDQLAVARTRSVLVGRSDARCLPFQEGTFDSVTALWISTDIERFKVVVAEVSRVLRPGGIFLLYGVHPCFNGPFVENLEDGSRLVHPGFGRRAAMRLRPGGRRRASGTEWACVTSRSRSCSKL